MPRLRRSAGSAIRLAASKTVSSPTPMRPCSGCWKPAIDIRVVDLPQPLGPSSVNSSPSLTVKSTLSSARWSPKVLTRPSTVISGIVASSCVDLEQLAADGEHDHRDGDLQHRERRNRPYGALDELSQHRRAHHLGPRLHEEHRRVIVVEQLDEEEDESREHRRPQQREDDAPACRPPACPGSPSGAIELLADPRQGGIHDDVRERNVAYAEGEHDSPDAVPEPVTERTGEQERPEEPDPDDDPGDRTGIEHHERQRASQPEGRAVRDERRQSDERRRQHGTDERDDQAVLDRVSEDAVVEHLPMAPREQVPRRDQRGQEDDERHQRQPEDGEERGEQQVEGDQTRERPAPVVQGEESYLARLAPHRDEPGLRSEQPVADQK